MAYTCAYYPQERTNLDQAQFAKMEACVPQTARECRRLGGRGGCGWGSLALHMAGRYGAKVRAFNISKEQLEFARRLARERDSRSGSNSSRRLTEYPRQL